MKYSDLINFSPIDSIIQINEADDKEKAISLTKSYVMSDDMAEKLEKSIISELQLEEVVDNKGVLLVGNYGTGKSHLMSVISAIASDSEYLKYVQNEKFAKDMECVAGKFEVLRIEIGSTTMSLRNIILSKVEQDFAKRGLSFSFPKEEEIINNKDVLEEMMEIFSSKYFDKGYLIVVDEFLDYLGGRKEQEIKLDLGFMRELGEMVKRSRLRVIFGMQEKLFENPNFSFVSETLNRVKDRFEQAIIRKEDTAYVVSERILKKTPEQKAKIREHLQQFCNLYTNMSEQLENYVELFPIHPAYIDVFNKIYIIENRHILKNISEIIENIMDEPVTDEAPGIVSFDSYWTFIKENYSYRTDVNIKEVVEKSEILEDIIKRSFPKKQYKDVALQMIYALSVHRLTTGDISIRSGLTSENLRDDLCIYLKGMPELDSEFLQNIVQRVLKDTMTTVSGQFIEYNEENGQYFLDLTKNIDFDEKITQKAAMLDDDTLNRSFFDVVYSCLHWDQTEHVTNFKIYEHTLNWESRNIFRRGYLFMGIPENRSTAQPPEDYYLYVLPPYGDIEYKEEKKVDEVFFEFKQDEEFNNNLRLYAASISMKELAEEKNKKAYQDKANSYKKKLTNYLGENRNTCFEVIYKGSKKQLIEVLKGKYNRDFEFKETIDTAASICLEDYFTGKYPNMPAFKTKITVNNQAAIIRAGIDHFAGRKNQQSKALLESFGLLDGDKISTKNSKYASYFANKLSKLAQKSVINFSDIYEPKFADYLDSEFKINYELLSIVLLALIHTGDTVMELKNGKTLTASNLDELPKTNAMDIYEFKYISKPKDMALKELIRLFEVLELPAGLINNPNEREKGIEKLIEVTSDYASKAVKASSKLNDEFRLWGEELIAEHVVKDYKSSIRNIVDEFSNFGSKYNTVAKLNNFNLSMEQVEALGKDIEILKIVDGYEVFRRECADSIGYIMNLELIELGEDFKSKLEDFKLLFRKVRDEIPAVKDGEASATKVNKEASKLKSEYIDIYFEEHQKRRLGISEEKQRWEIINSPKMSKLNRLKSISILSKTKFDLIEKVLSGLKVCYELTSADLKSTHVCPHCKFMLGEKSKAVSGQLDNIESNIDALLGEWTNTLLNTISDPLVLENKEYLDEAQQKVIEKFLEDKQLPNTVDSFFINSIVALLEGFDPVEIDTDDLMHKIDEIGPCDVDTFNKKLIDIISEYTAGKDKERLRIVVKR
ncbi:hypothetical protein EUAN_02660 [Andreesenia angusta]|uniref:Uncharacterized protein n=1 Tax=Andreesenia angusta TaxID=39480 RepID=A0A1S1V9Z7_9FIRM|nr:DUF6079 family protein [Andreesenia angusta]OHW63402.1 hypothetical protein EUAN_02660 [Andreesenia angusta]